MARNGRWNCCHPPPCAHSPPTPLSLSLSLSQTRLRVKPSLAPYLAVLHARGVKEGQSPPAASMSELTEHAYRDCTLKVVWVGGAVITGGMYGIEGLQQQ